MSIQTRSKETAVSQHMGLAGALVALAAIGVAVVAGAWYALRDESTSTPPAVPAPGIVEAAPNSSFAPGNVRTPATIFVVANESQKLSLEADIEEVARIRHSTGADAAKETVVIMASDEDLLAYAESVESSNSHLASLGLEGDVIVDLRPR